MQSLQKKLARLAAIIDEQISQGLSEPAAIAAAAIQELAEEWPDIRDGLALKALIQKSQSRLKLAARRDPDQYVIPGFEHAPVFIVIDQKPIPLLKSTPDQAEAFLKWRESMTAGKIEGAVKQQAENKQLREVIQKVRPFCIAPSMTIEDGLREYAKKAEGVPPRLKIVKKAKNQ